MFEKASRKKIRFDSSKGQLTIEDLWDLPLTSATGRVNLDDTARELYRQLKSGDDISFVVKERKSDELIQLKFDIIKHIIEVRVAEAEARSTEKENSLKKQHLLQLISDKQDEALKGKSVEELKAELAKL